MEETAPKQLGWLRRNYHWVIAVTTLFMYMIQGGMANILYSLYLIPITEDLQISRSAFALASTIGSIPGFFANLVYPYVYRRIGFRRLVGGSFLINSLFYIGYSFSHSMTLFYIGAAVVGFCSAFCGTSGISTLITDWFHKHQGVILGVALAGSGLGAALFTMIMNAVLQGVGWRMAMLISAVILMSCGILCSLILRNKPEDMGLLPLGDEQDKHAERKKHARDFEEWHGQPMSVLKKRGYLYVIIAAMFLIGMADYIINPTVISHMQDMGMSKTEAASVQSLMFLFLAGAKIFEGWLSDRFGARKVMYFCVACCFVSALILAEVTVLWLAMLGVLIFSMALAVVTVMVPVLTADAFGRQAYSVVLGILLACMYLCMGLGPAFANAVYDILGSYTPVYYGVSVVCVLVTVMLAFSFRRVSRERAELEE